MSWYRMTTRTTTATTTDTTSMFTTSMANTTTATTMTTTITTTATASTTTAAVATTTPTTTTNATATATTTNTSYYCISDLALAAQPVPAKPQWLHALQLGDPLWVAPRHSSHSEDGLQGQVIALRKLGAHTQLDVTCTTNRAT